MTTIDVSKPAAAPEAGRLTAFAWLALAALGAAVFFGAGLASLPTAWARPEYSHGYLIPAIAVFLLLSRLRGIETITLSHQWAGVAVLVLGLAVGAIGNLASIPDLIVHGFVICLAGLLLVAVGLRAGISLWVPIVYLAFMMPLPNFLYWQASAKLQILSSKIGTWVISALGVPVYLEGNIIDLGIYQLQVAEACSGLNYLFPLMSFGFLFAVLYRGPVWHKIVLFLSSLPITVLMNSLRIAVIGLLVDRYGIEQAEGFLHFFEGWVIFVACLVLLFAIAWLLQRLARHPQPIGRMLDLSSDGLVDQARRLGPGLSSRPFAVAALLIAGAGLAWQLAPAHAVTPAPREQFGLFPAELGEWRGSFSSLDPEIERVLTADDVLLADFQSATEIAPVNLFVAYYASQIADSGIHSPEVCIPAGGWEVSGWETRPSGFRLPSGELLEVNRAIVQKGLQRQLVYYWFDQRGRTMTGDVTAKIMTVWDSMTRGRTDGALVRLVTPIGKGEAVAQADDRLSRFLAQSYPALARFVPGTQ